MEVFLSPDLHFQLPRYPSPPLAAKSELPKYPALASKYLPLHFYTSGENTRFSSPKCLLRVKILNFRWHRKLVFEKVKLAHPGSVLRSLQPRHYRDFLAVKAARCHINLDVGNSLELDTKTGFCSEGGVVLLENELI